VKDEKLFGKTTNEILEIFHSSTANGVFIENHPGYNASNGESFLSYMDCKTKKLLEEHPELVKAMI